MKDVAEMEYEMALHIALVAIGDMEELRGGAR
jgi:hypothetical protein